ncbi:MAG TPA: hypothetical protein PL163_03625, partial [Leptospiraceae bacterium]|nr:hypothetical protein [Leptospiraceae bacterium]
DSWKNKDRKKNWRNILIFLDLLLLMFVFYLVSKKFSSVSEYRKSSEKKIFESTEWQLTRSNTEISEQLGYFLFAKNLSSTPIVPDRLKAVLTLKSETGLICKTETFVLPKQKILPNERAYYSLEFHAGKHSEYPAECSGLFRHPPFPKTVYNAFDFSKKYRVDMILQLKTGEAELKFVIEDERLRF